MTTERQKFGFAHENLAAAYLKQRGYRIIEQNYRTAAGEIDIIAVDGETLVFVEVKSRRSHRFGSAKHAVTRNKQIKLTKTALWYLKQTGKTRQKARFDVVAIDSGKHPPDIELIRNAFEAAYG